MQTSAASIQYDEHDYTTTLIVQPGNRSFSYAYDKQGNQTRLTDARGNDTETTYDALYRVLEVNAPLNTTIKNSYDARDNLITLIDPRNNRTEYSYDALNRLTQTTDALSQTLKNLEYDGNDNLLREEDKRGTITTHTYDDLNRLLTSSKPDGEGNTVRLIRNEYDAAGNATRITDAENNVTQISFNPRHQPEETTYADNSSTKQAFDGLGNVYLNTDELNQQVCSAYDGEGRLIGSSNQAGESSTYRYDQNGNQTRKQNPEGDWIQYDYDAFDQLTKVDYLAGAGISTQYIYDKNDNLSRQTDANGHVVDYDYDDLNRRITHSQHKAGGNLISRYGYDEAGNQISQTDPKGQTISTDYDALNRETLRSYPFDAGPYINIQSIQTQYDANGNIRQITENKTGGGITADITTYSYDQLDRKQSTTQRGRTIDYDYDLNGNRTRVSSTGGSTSYTFDQKNRLETAEETGNASSTTNYVYQDNGLLKTVSYPNNTQAAYAYFAYTNRIQSVENRNTQTNTQISRFEYTYDKNGNRLSQIEQHASIAGGSPTNTDYSYDNLNRLTAYTQSGASNKTVNYPQIDKVGNRIQEQISEGGTTINKTYEYDETNWLQKIQLDGGDVLYSYDANGNINSKTDQSLIPNIETQFIYNVRDQLVQTTRGPPNSAPTETLGQYDYNAQGMRIRHKHDTRGDIESYYDDSSVLDENELGTNTQIAHYTYADRLLSLATPANKQYYHSAALGSTTDLTDESGNTQISYQLDPWGKIEQQAGTSVNRQIFTGQEHDEKTGLIYFGSRYMDPDTGRFISQDSYLGEFNAPPSLHRYQYVYGNPGAYVDPNGNFAVLEGMTDRLGELREEMIDRAAESNLAGIVANGLGAGLAGVLEFGTGALNLAGDLAVDAYADENSDSFFVQDSRRSLSETTTTLNNVKTAVTEHPADVLASIGNGIASTASGIARLDKRSIAQGFAFGFEALTGAGLSKSVAGATNSAARGIARSTGPIIAKITKESRAGVNRIVSQAVDAGRKVAPYLNPRNYEARAGASNIVSGMERALGSTSGHQYAGRVFKGGSGKAFAGHGQYKIGSGDVSVPKGTAVTLPREGISILDKTGRYIEAGDWDGLARAAAQNPRIADDISGLTTWLPGSKVPNYTLSAPTSPPLKIYQKSTTVETKTYLNELLDPNMGCVQWAACTVITR